jgi:hypothetical protein
MPAMGPAGGEGRLLGLAARWTLAVMALIAFTGRASSVWSRLCLNNGLAALALSLEAIAISVMIELDVVSHASLASGGSDAYVGAPHAGAIFGGAMLDAAVYVGLFVGAIFLTLTFFLRDRPAWQVNKLAARPPSKRGGLIDFPN